MPIYKYICECNNQKEVMLSYADWDKPQVCECGKTMQRKLTAPTFVMKSTGRGMALDTLNSNNIGGKRKNWAANHAAQGL